MLIDNTNLLEKYEVPVYNTLIAQNSKGIRIFSIKHAVPIGEKNVAMINVCESYVKENDRFSAERRAKLTHQKIVNNIKLRYDGYRNREI